MTRTRAAARRDGTVDALRHDVPVDFDALLFLSFGGPNGPDDVRPFLENVTRGRNVPPERLDDVAEHYHHFGGVSPINRLNTDIIDQLRKELASRGRRLPIYFGNRNWHPMIADTVSTMAADGVRRALVFATSAWGGYSGCRQYQDDIAQARAAVGPAAPELMKLRQFFDHPRFVELNAAAVRRGYAELGAVPDASNRLVFTAHSIPVRADALPGADGGPQWYSRQVARSCALVATAAGVTDYDLAWQSRSGPPQMAWLEPDINDHLRELSDAGTQSVVVSPIGFVSDHLEVVWDLDNEAHETAAALGLGFARADTAGSDPGFAAMIADLIDEQCDGAAPRQLSCLVSAGCSLNGAACVPNCCSSAGR